MPDHGALHGMAAVRFLSGLLEIVCAVLFLRLGKVETALRINAFLGLVGPLIFVIVGVLGIVAVAVRLPPLKVALLTLGTLLVLMGTGIH
ncbi:MAG: DUF2619 domain-containing protein [Patescibacteria group bacterium]